MDGTTTGFGSGWGPQIHAKSVRGESSEVPAGHSRLVSHHASRALGAGNGLHRGWAGLRVVVLLGRTVASPPRAGRGCDVNPPTPRDTGRAFNPPTAQRQPTDPTTHGTRVQGTPPCAAQGRGEKPAHPTCGVDLSLVRCPGRRGIPTRRPCGSGADVQPAPPRDAQGQGGVSACQPRDAWASWRWWSTAVGEARQPGSLLRRCLRGWEVGWRSWPPGWRRASR